MANIFDEIDPRGGSRQSANAATDNSVSASSNIFDQIDPRGGAPAKAKQPAAADNRDTGSFPRRPVMQLGQEDASGHRFAETTTEYNTPDDASQERGIVQRTREGAAAPMEGEHGFSQESLQKYPWLSWLQPRAKTLDVAARTPSSILGGLAGAGAGVVEKLPTWLGGGPSQADRMQRDLTAAPNALAGLVPEAPAGFPRPLAREVAANVPKPPTPPPLPREPPAPVARQVARPGVGVDLLPTETPHTLPPQRPALSAAGFGGPLSDVSPETIAHMRAVMEEQGFNQHTIDQRLSELSAHHFLGEITPSLEADMGAVALPPGPGKLEVMGSIRQRALEARERTQHEFDRAFGVNENIPQLTKIIEGDRARAAGPLYRKFRETEITPTPEIDALMPRLEAAGALRAANRDLAVEGEPATHGFADPQNPDSTRRVPTAGAFQAVAEHLGDKIKGALAEEGGMGEARRLTGLRNALLKALDEHPQVGDTWRQARAAYAQPSQVLNAVRMGQKALSNRVLADDLPFLTSSFSEPEMRGLRIGMRGHLEQMLGKKDTLTAETINTVLSPNNVQKLRWAIGDVAADQLVAAMEHERHMHTAPQRIHGGSPTAARIEANKRWSVQPKDEGMTLGDVGGYIRHPIRSITGAGLEAADKFGVRHRRAANETRMARLREEASHIFTLQGPQRDAVARYLVEGEPHQLDPITVTAPPRKRGGAVHGDPRERALRTVQRRFGGRIGYAEGGDTGRAFPSMLNAMETSAQDSLIREGLDPGVGGLRGVQGLGSFAPVAFPKSVDEPRPSRGKSYFKGETRDPNAGVDAPVNAKIQTVADPHRMMFPGIYRNPREIADEAAARVGPEDISMKRLFGVSRGDLREMAQGRVGNEEPKVNLVANPRGSVSAQNIQTPQNTKRLTDILEEAGKHEGLRTADAWYIMDPAFKRMQELFGGEAAKRYSHLNTMTGMASPGSNVNAEIARGTAAHWLEQQGRFQDFQKFAGIPENLRAVMPSFPPDMRRIPGHPYHRTSQGDPMEKYLDTGAIQSAKAKVPLYVHASGVPETGFQTTGPVGDAHFSRGVGLSDTRKGPSNVEGSFQRPEYQTLQPWWQRDVAGKVGLESVPAQARLWTALGPQTGVESALGAPKLELLSAQIMRAAHRLGVSPEKARDMVLSGHAGAFRRGGGVPHMADGGDADPYRSKIAETSPYAGIDTMMPETAFAHGAPILDPLAKSVLSMATSLPTLPRRTFEALDHYNRTGEYDAAPFVEAATLPMGTGAIAGVPMRAGEAVLGAGAIRRPPFPEKFPDVVVQRGPGSAMRVTQHPDFAAAKTGDSDAASRVVRDAIDDRAVEKLRAQLGDRRPMIVPVQALEEKGFNALPSEYADALSHRLGLDVHPDIVQANRPMRTGKDAAYRMGRRAEFDGPVEPGRDYLLADDAVTMGGTLADLRGYIEGKGGNVVGATTLMGSPFSHMIAPRAGSLAQLRAKLPDLEDWWKQAHGHGFEGLTDSEAKYLSKFGSSDAVRTRFPPRAEPQFAEERGVAPGSEAPLDVRPGLEGSPGGADGVREAQLQAQRRAGPHQPLPGLPLGAQVVEGQPFYPGPVAAAHDVAQAYMKDKDFGLPTPDRYHPVDVEHSRAIAKAFEDMPHAPNDPQVKAAYDALAKETLDQYRAIKATGLKITPVNAADYPYHGNPRAVVKDVADNNHMAFFKSREGFGNEEADLTHPLMRSSGEKVGDHDMLYNDLFRVVHDYFGHIKNGFGFRGAGEDNAFRAHAPMYSPLARRAMTTETRGQNSWLNYGPHGDFNRTANAADTIYADQKVGLMPEWTMSDRVPESIRSSAIRHGGQVFEGPLHAHAYEKAAQATGQTFGEVIGKTKPQDAGFVTSTGRFVSREEAKKIAEGAEQVPRGLKSELAGEHLFGSGGAVGDDYNTPLNPAEEMAFQAWKKLNAPNDSGRDYDLRGASQANMQRDPASGHFFDQFKKPNHPTFSDQSQYATGALRRQAGTWTGDAYAPPSPMARGGLVGATLRAHRSRNTP